MADKLAGLCGFFDFINTNDLTPRHLVEAASSPRPFLGSQADEKIRKARGASNTQRNLNDVGGNNNTMSLTSHELEEMFYETVSSLGKVDRHGYELDDTKAITTDRIRIFVSSWDTVRQSDICN